MIDGRLVRFSSHNALAAPAYRPITQPDPSCFRHRRPAELILDLGT
jgi:hypothetical protein